MYVYTTYICIIDYKQYFTTFQQVSVTSRINKVYSELTDCPLEKFLNESYFLHVSQERSRYGTWW